MGPNQAGKCAGKARDSYHSTEVYPDDSLPVAIPRCFKRFHNLGARFFNVLGGFFLRKKPLGD
jgi:hypothetical protein